MNKFLANRGGANAQCKQPGKGGVPWFTYSPQTAVRAAQ